MQLPKDDKGFDQFPTLQNGWSALNRQVKKDALPERKHTVDTFIEKYAPASDNNKHENYVNYFVENVNNAARELGKVIKFTADTPLKTIVDTIGEKEVAKIIAKKEDSKTYKKLEQANFFESKPVVSVATKPIIKTPAKTNTPVIKNKASLKVKEMPNPSRVEEAISTIKNEGLFSFFEQVGNMISSPEKVEPVITKPIIKKEVVKKSTEKIAAKPIEILGDTIKNYNEDKNRFIVPFRMKLNDLTVGIRNRGDYSKDIKTEGAVFSTYKKFQEPNNVEEYNFNKFISVNLETGKVKIYDRPKDSNFKLDEKNKKEMITGTYAHKVSHIDLSKNSYNKGIQASTIGYVSPEGKSSSINVLGVGSTGNELGGYYGGKVIITTPNNTNPEIIYGSAKHIQQQVEKYKKENNIKYVYLLEADGKAYAQTYQTKNKTISKETQQYLDNLNSNAAGSGNFIYLK